MGIRISPIKSFVLHEIISGAPLRTAAAAGTIGRPSIKKTSVLVSPERRAHNLEDLMALAWFLRRRAGYLQESST